MQAHPPSAGGCAQVSRGAPPPLPGGYKVGEKVFYTGASETVSTGDRLMHGQQGEVVGPATNERVTKTAVNVRFPGNNGNVNCYLSEVRRLHAASAATPATHATLPTPRAAAIRQLACAPAPSPNCKRSCARRSPTPREREG